MTAPAALPPGDDPARRPPAGPDRQGPVGDPAVAALVRTLHTEAADLRAGDRLGELRDRVRSGRRRSWTQVAAAGAVAAAVLVGVGVLRQRPAAPPPGPGHPIAAARSDPSDVPPPAVGDPHPLPVYYLGRDGARWALYREFHPRAPAEGRAEPDRLVAALRAATTAGTALDPDLGVPWSRASSDAAISTGDGVVTVDLPAVEGQALGRTGEQARLAVQQLVWTASAVRQDGALRVRVLIAGRPGRLFGAEWVGTAVARADPADAVLGSVWVQAPDEGQQVLPPVTVRGSVCAHGSTLHWQLLRDGVVLRSGQVPVASGCPTRDSWSVRLDRLAPGRYTVRAFERGTPGTRAERADTRTFTVR